MNNKVNFGKSIQTNMICFARPDEQEPNGFKLILVDKDMRYWMNDEDINIATVPVEYFPPENMNKEELVLKAIESLRDKQKQILANAQRHVDQLNEKINQLQMLTYQPLDESDNVIDINGGNHA
jgi:hypothetical protein